MPSNESTVIAATIQISAHRASSRATESSASRPQIAPLAVSKWTAQAAIVRLMALRTYQTC